MKIKIQVTIEDIEAAVSARSIPLPFTLYKICPIAQSLLRQNIAFFGVSTDQIGWTPDYASDLPQEATEFILAFDYRRNVQKLKPFEFEVDRTIP